jgi:hypothetical protein
MELISFLRNGVYKGRTYNEVVREQGDEKEVAGGW